MMRVYAVAVIAGLASATSASAYMIDPLTRQPVETFGSGQARSTVVPREQVDFGERYPAGTIVVSTSERRLYYVLGNGKAIRYAVGVGRKGFDWSGINSVTAKREWPDWRAPAEMLRRRPDIPSYMPGGPDNPLGARAMYIGSTEFRIHGSNEPETIGQAVSSGCIRMTNEDVIDLYDRVNVGTRVVVLK
jgi:lipoprotein-anchoring transpeptidase ErfK/SrfK